MPLLKPSEPPKEWIDLCERYQKMQREYDEMRARITGPWEQLIRDITGETIQ